MWKDEITKRTTDGKMGLESASYIYKDRVKMGKVQQTRLVVTCHRIRKVTNMEWRAEEEIIG